VLLLGVLDWTSPPGAKSRSVALQPASSPARFEDAPVLLKWQNPSAEKTNPGLRVVDPPALINSVQPGPSRWQNWLVRYGASLVAAGVCLGIWRFWPAVERDPFVLFLAAVILTARFFGFGPALLCTLASVVCIDLVAFPPLWRLTLSMSDFERLMLFLLVSVISASIARQRSRAEINASEARQRMAAIVEFSDDAIFSTTREGSITSWNHGAELLYGYSAEEVLGRNVALVVPPERADEVYRHRARLNRGEHIESFRTERMRKDGTRVDILLSISPLRNNKGGVVGSSGIARDITAQQRAEDALLRSEKLATAGRMAAAIAHEINNPLEAVLNLLYLARRDPMRAEQYLGVAEKEVQRVASIAQQTLGLVRFTPSPLPLRVSEIVEDALLLYSRRLENRHIQVEKQYSTECEIQGFPGELRQVFSNLLVNAVDAMEDGGRLRLRVARGHEWSGAGRSGVRVTIADNGMGIPASVKNQLFEPFYTTKGEVGTGLGLWLSQSIVRKHDGRIRVRSSVNPVHRGTVFMVFLPEQASLQKSQGRNPVTASARGA